MCRLEVGEHSCTRGLSLEPMFREVVFFKAATVHHKMSQHVSNLSECHRKVVRPMHSQVIFLNVWSVSEQV